MNATEKKDLKSSLIKGSAATSVGTIVSMIFHFFSIMLLTRHLTTDDFGVYILILTIVHFINIITGLGLNPSIVKMIASQESSEKQGVLSATYWIRSGTLFLSAVFFYVFGRMALGMHFSQVIPYILYIPILFILGSFRDLFYSIYQGVNAFQKYAAVQIISAILRILLIWLAFRNDLLTLKNLIYIELIISLFTVIVQLILMPWRSLNFSKPGENTYKKLLGFGFPLYSNSIFNFVIERVNIFLLGFYLLPESVAFFDVSDKIPQAFKKIYSSFIIVYFPNFAKAYSKTDNHNARQVMETAMILINAVLTASVLVSFLFGEDLIALVFSEKYRYAGFSFSLLMLAFQFKSLSNIMGYSLVGAGHPAVTVKTNLISSIFGIGLSLLSIPKFGFIGATWSIVAMNLLSTGIYTWIVNKHLFRIRIISILKPLLPASLMYFVYQMTGLDSAYFKGIIILLFAGILYFWIGEINSNFKSFIKYIGKKIRF